MSTEHFEPCRIMSLWQKVHFIIGPFLGDVKRQNYSSYNFEISKLAFFSSFSMPADLIHEKLMPLRNAVHFSEQSPT